MATGIYTAGDLIYVEKFSIEIKQYAAAMGISATAIAGAIAKENNSYNAIPIVHVVLDEYAVLSLASDYQVRLNLAEARALGYADLSIGYGLDTRLKIYNPVMIDMGIANIKVATAVGLLEKYYADNPATDPLGLKDRYQDNYQNIVVDLDSSGKNVLTAKLATLMIREAQDFYTTLKYNANGQPLHVRPEDWAALSQEERDGLLVMYFCMGNTKMSEKRDENVATNGFFNPRLGDGESGGLRTYQNAPAIGNALNVPGYGQNQMLQLGLDTDPVVRPGLVFSSNVSPSVTPPPDLDTPSRNSVGYFTANDAHSVVVGAGGTVSDLWVTQRNAANGIANANEFYAAVLASNPGIADINSIQAGQTIYLPQKLTDGSVTYHYANGASINSNAVTGEYRMAVPNAEGGQTVFSRTADEFGYTVRQIQTDAAGGILFDYTGYQQTLDSEIKSFQLAEQLAPGVQRQQADTNGDGVFDKATTTADTNLDGETDKLSIETRKTGGARSVETFFYEEAELTSHEFTTYDADGKTTKILRDADGDGNYEQQERIATVGDPLAFEVASRQLGGPEDAGYSTLLIDAETGLEIGAVRIADAALSADDLPDAASPSSTLNFAQYFFESDREFAGSAHEIRSFVGLETPLLVGDDTPSGEGQPAGTVWLENFDTFIGPQVIGQQLAELQDDWLLGTDGTVGQGSTGSVPGNATPELDAGVYTIDLSWINTPVVGNLLDTVGVTDTFTPTLPVWDWTLDSGWSFNSSGSDLWDSGSGLGGYSSYSLFDSHSYDLLGLGNLLVINLNDSLDLDFNLNPYVGQTYDLTVPLYTVNSDTFYQGLSGGGLGLGGGYTFDLGFDLDFSIDLYGPVVLDLDGDGIELVAASASRAWYDLDGKGGRFHTGWVGADDALLAIDDNGDGEISSGREISFSLYTEDDTTDTDMEALGTVFDTDHDGRLDAGDARFAEFRLWQDANGNGESDAGEVRTLEEAGIAAVGAVPVKVEYESGGNRLLGKSQSPQHGEARVRARWPAGRARRPRSASVCAGAVAVYLSYDITFVYLTGIFGRDTL